MNLGLDQFLKSHKKIKPFAILANYGSLNKSFKYSWELLKKKYPKAFQFIFSPQHGLMGCEQMNMIESNSYFDSNFELNVTSLYADKRKPSPEQLSKIKLLIVDLQDVGSKYYTYIYTLALCMQAAKENNIKVIILDRPNPLGGNFVYGNTTKEFSFVGMYPIPIVHGMTIGEIAKLFNEEYKIGCELEIVKMSGWKRSMEYPQTKLKFQMLSPNMPTFETCLVYPGGCLLEGTNISQGRGTTRPFECFGAPFIESEKLKNEILKFKLKDVIFRSISFKPTFDYYANEVCHGLFVHPLEKKFNAYLTYLMIISLIRKLYPNNFDWRKPPYEYEYHKNPFDIITGDVNIRKMVESESGVRDFNDYCEKDIKPFLKIRKKFLMYG